MSKGDPKADVKLVIQNVLSQGREFFKAKQYEQAIKEFDHVTQLVEQAIPQEDEFYRAIISKACTNSANCHFHLKNYTKAVELSSAVLAVDFYYNKAIFRRGLALKKLSQEHEKGDVVAALAYCERSGRDFERALKLEKDNTDQHKAIKDKYTELKELATRLAAARKENQSQALALYQRLLKSPGQNPTQKQLITNLSAIKDKPYVLLKYLHQLGMDNLTPERVGQQSMEIIIRAFAGRTELGREQREAWGKLLAWVCRGSVYEAVIKGFGAQQEALARRIRAVIDK